MPKNSRPDIQVLEDRIVRLKAQLLEYKELRLYTSTKNRLSKVADGLEDCISIINEIVTAETNNISNSSLSAVDESGFSISEFSTDCDLIDTELLPKLNTSTSITSAVQDSPVSTEYSAKDITSFYSARIHESAESNGLSSGVLQVNQFWRLLDNWYSCRFNPPKRNENFRYKANRIHEWIDILMIAAGQALHEGTFPKFLQDMNDWSSSLNSDSDEGYVLPYCVMQLRQTLTTCCTKEAVLIEDMIKPFLYNKDFYPKERHSVRRIVMENSTFDESDLDLMKILDTSPRLIKTSSFDIDRYREERRVV